ncbi:MAG TPA: hypothetical protein VF584_25880 [Longimicrobium sp.]|jgi:hypothetical protein
MTIDQLLAGYSPEVRDLALRACELVRAVLPDAVVKVHPGWKNIIFGTGPRMGNMVVAVIPHTSRINLQLVGADLPDPAGLLEGTGKMGRHVKVASPAVLENPAVRDLLLAAVAHQSHPAAERVAKAGRPADGYRAYASKTVNVPLDTLFAAWTDDDTRRRWLGDHPVTIRGTTPGKSLRARWADMPIDVRFESKSDAKSSVSVDHRGIASEEEAAALKASWGAALESLKALLAR